MTSFRASAARPRLLARLMLALVMLAPFAAAQAFTATITAGTRAMYLRVGTGSATGNYSSGGTMQNNTTIDDLTATVPAAQIGNATPLAMTSTSSQGGSYYDGYAFCDAPAEVYIGGFYRRPSSTGSATLVATAPTNLTNAGGQTISFTDISWTSSGNGETGAQPIPAGTFAGGAQTLATFPTNSWRESCHTFTYANDTVVASGTYTGRVVYTLSAP